MGKPRQKGDKVLPEPEKEEGKDKGGKPKQS